MAIVTHTDSTPRRYDRSRAVESPFPAHFIGVQKRSGQLAFNKIDLVMGDILCVAGRMTVPLR